MIMQLIIGGSFFAMFFYSMLQSKHSTAVSRVLQLLAVVGFILAMIPELSIWVADLVGVSRGVDVALYLYVPLSLVLLMHINAKLRRENMRVTVLTREIALLDNRLSKLTGARRVESGLE